MLLVVRKEMTKVTSKKFEIYITLMVQGCLL